MTYTTATVHTGGQIHRRRTMPKISGRFGAMAGATALMGMMLAAAIAAPAQTFTTLLNFDGNDGDYPAAGLVQAINGNLYGTTYGCGGGFGCGSDYGTVFKITPVGTLTVLDSFNV